MQSEGESQCKKAIFYKYFRRSGKNSFIMQQSRLKRARYYSEQDRD